jgi:hypothetical protein
VMYLTPLDLFGSMGSMKNNSTQKNNVVSLTPKMREEVREMIDRAMQTLAKALVVDFKPSR